MPNVLYNSRGSDGDFFAARLEDFASGRAQRAISDFS
jgi:hypothetical protein